MFGSTVPGGTVNCGATFDVAASHLPVFRFSASLPIAVCCGLGKKSCNEATPFTTGVSAAGICCSELLAKCTSPSTMYLCKLVWKALFNAAGVPEKNTIIRSGVALVTFRPCEDNHCVTLDTSSGAGPNILPICSSVNQ